MSIQSTNTLGEYLMAAALVLAVMAALVLVAAACARPRDGGALDRAGRHGRWPRRAWRPAAVRGRRGWRAGVRVRRTQWVAGSRGVPAFVAQPACSAAGRPCRR